MRKGFYERSGSNPSGYYRSGLKTEAIRRLMLDSGPLTVSQVAASLMDLVPPEAKLRSLQLNYGGVGALDLPLHERLFAGMRIIVRLRLGRLSAKGKVKKNGSGREAKYEWIEAQDNQAGQDSA